MAKRRRGKSRMAKNHAPGAKGPVKASHKGKGRKR